MQIVELQDAELHFAELVDAAAKGEPFVIARDGKALVEVSAVKGSGEKSERKPLVFGSLAGTMHIPDDFDRMYEDEIREMFEGDGKL